MKLQHIVGNTYYINYPSVVGVYIFDDNYCLLIDSGASKAFGLRTMKILQAEGLKVHSIVNTHFHGDHSGGNQVIQLETNCNIYASRLDKLFLDNPILSPFGIYSAYPIEPLQNKFLMQEPCLVTHEIQNDIVEIKQENFKIINLSGHTLGQIGIVTPDDVFFVGDAIISERNLNKFPFLYIANLALHFDTISRLLNTNYPYVILSHDGLLNNWREMLINNERQIRIIINIILNNLQEPLSREKIIDKVIKELGLPITTSQYFLISASISAYLSYLHTKKIIKTVITDRQVKFVCK